MSVGYVPKNELTADQALAVQELAVCGTDYALYAISGGNLIIYIREPVAKVENAFLKVDSSNTITNFNAAEISIVDTKGALSGYNEFGVMVSNQGAIQLTGVSALNPNDCLIVKYEVASHL